jgi:hypothetical protein
MVALCAHRHFSLRLGLRIPCWYSIDSHTNRHLFRAITINKRPGSGAGVGRGTAHRFALRCSKSVLPRFVALVLYETRQHLGTKLCRATDQRSPYREESTMRLARRSPATDRHCYSCGFFRTAALLPTSSSTFHTSATCHSNSLPRLGGLRQTPVKFALNCPWL